MGEPAPEVLDKHDKPIPLNDIDREILETKEEDWHLVTWADLKHIIETNTLEELKRPPDDTRRYLAWKNDIKERYGSINDFVVAERLHWPLDEANSANGPAFVHKSKIPFEERSDYAVLVNDWPYGFEEGIKHVCVWSKTPIATDDERGDITPESRKLIEAFIERHFARDLGEGGSERVQWFKNWVSLQSVKGVDHVHVLIRNAPPELLDGWLERKDL